MQFFFNWIVGKSSPLNYLLCIFIKVKGHPVSKRFLKYSDPVKTKGQEVCSTPDSTPEVLYSTKIIIPLTALCCITIWYIVQLASIAFINISVLCDNSWLWMEGICYIFNFWVTFCLYAILYIYWNWQIVEDLRERYETSDSPIIHKIQEYVIEFLFALILVLGN